jgi:hypothetical protein
VWNVWGETSFVNPAAIPLHRSFLNPSQTISRSSPPLPCSCPAALPAPTAPPQPPPFDAHARTAAHRSRSSDSIQHSALCPTPPDGSRTRCRDAFVCARVAPPSRLPTTPHTTTTPTTTCTPLPVPLLSAAATRCFAAAAVPAAAARVPLSLSTVSITPSILVSLRNPRSSDVGNPGRPCRLCCLLPRPTVFAALRSTPNPCHAHHATSHMRSNPGSPSPSRITPSSHSPAPWVMTLAASRALPTRRTDLRHGGGDGFR